MDANKSYLDGAGSYTVTLPPDIPQARFWSLTLYDNQTRSMLVTPQRYPRAGSQTYPSPAAVANPDGSTTIHVGPEQPAGVPDGNWIQTDPARGSSPSSACTAHCNRSSTSRGRSASSNPTSRSSHDGHAHSDPTQRPRLVLDA